MFDALGRHIAAFSLVVNEMVDVLRAVETHELALFVGVSVALGNEGFHFVYRDSRGSANGLGPEGTGSLLDALNLRGLLGILHLSQILR